jgi:hypothetical protein
MGMRRIMMAETIPTVIKIRMTEAAMMIRMTRIIKKYFTLGVSYRLPGLSAKRELFRARASSASSMLQAEGRMVL